MKPMIIAALLLSTSAAFGENALVASGSPSSALFPAALPIAEVARASTPSHRAFTLSLISLAAAQGLDAGSSWGHRETNPLMASADGSFGMKAAGIKIGFVAGAVAAEYLLLNRHPSWEKLLARLNTGGAIMTTGFAVHNFIVVH